MSKKGLQDSFKEFCKKNSFENNNQQIEIVNLLDKFFNPRKFFLSYHFNYEIFPTITQWGWGVVLSRWNSTNSTPWYLLSLFAGEGLRCV